MGSTDRLVIGLLFVGFSAAGYYGVPALKILDTTCLYVLAGAGVTFVVSSLLRRSQKRQRATGKFAAHQFSGTKK